MTKQPFTPDGVKLKTTELYALSDQNLQVQSDLIATQFPTWMRDNFSLTTQQDDYLSAMDQEYVDFLADETSGAIGKKLPIILVGPVNPPTQGTGSKRIDTKSTSRKVVDAGVVKATTGELTIEISYPE
ncbi:hypothetical protein [Mucilaginibacter polytrichastri]|uniref:hypothetical protein n=1 Tax=Mucilaginibacter polytrichastri TaxID=1302689 RepID=UPI0008EA8D1F|nr:hypothetical protein [Mucilaginibacter polytrichastri]SFS61963.1 hypothetical protein SAMN04487890_102430 [Mucilaginibacter polytrichastri]